MSDHRTSKDVTSRYAMLLESLDEAQAGTYQGYNWDLCGEAAKAVRELVATVAQYQAIPELPTIGREVGLQRVIDRHVRWRETALGFLHQIVDGRGTEDEWPALAEFIERSESRISEASDE